jgi:hypothetical protein
MNEIQERQDRRDQLLKEADQLHTQMLPFEAALENEQSIRPAQERELRDKYKELKRRFDSHNAQATVDQTGRCPAPHSTRPARAAHSKTSGHAPHLTITYSGHISSPLSTKACAVDNGSAGISMENCTCRKEET